MATRSGETEFYGMFKAGSRAVGLKLMAGDYGLEREAELHADATAGLGMASRERVGKVRHLHTQALWVQAAVRDKRLQLKKVKGTYNPSNLPTKHVDQQSMLDSLKAMGYEPREGKARSAIEVAEDEK